MDEENRGIKRGNEGRGGRRERKGEESGGEWMRV